jgi:hypothetical protein
MPLGSPFKLPGLILRTKRSYGQRCRATLARYIIAQGAKGERDEALVVHAAVAHVHAICDGIAKRSAALSMTFPQMPRI